MRSRTSLLAAALWASLAAPAAPAPPDSWVEVRTPGFSVFSDDGEKAARRVAARLEEMRGFLLEEWPWARFAPELPIVVLAIAERSRLGALLPVHHTRTGLTMVAGMTYFEPHRTLILLRTNVPEDRTEDNPYHVAYHEYVHAVLGRSLRLPPWLSEGTERRGAGVARWRSRPASRRSADPRRGRGGPAVTRAPPGGQAAGRGDAGEGLHSVASRVDEWKIAFEPPET